MDHITSATTAFPAVAGKCISGFETRCSCGLVMRSSLIGIALADVREHLAWAAKQPRKAPHGTAGTQCMGHLAPIYGIGDNGYPRLHHKRCLRRIGVTVWQGAHGQILAACPLHKREVEAQDAPYRTDPDWAHRIRHEAETEGRLA